MRIIAAFILALSLVLPVAPTASAQFGPSAFPIMGDNGQPVYNRAVPKELRGAAERLRGAVVAGNPKGDVTLIEFYDLNCPFCRRASDDVDALIRSDKNLKVVLVPYPVLGIPSVLAGRVELAVARTASPDVFYQFHRKIYAGRGVIDGNRALAVVRELKLNETKLLELADDDDTTDTMKSHAQLGGALGMQATPGFVIADVAIVGYPGPGALRKVIDSARRCGKVVC